jgi:hypothetical protein
VACSVAGASFLDRKEGIRTFIRENLKLFRSQFSETNYREAKRAFFVDKLRNEVGNPRDTEIARGVMDHLIDIGVVRSDLDLEKVLSHQFLREKVVNPHEYWEKLHSRGGVEGIVITPSEARQAEFMQKFRDKVVETIIEEEKEKIKEGIESTLFPSILDSKSSGEPPPPRVPETSAGTLWWQELNLEADPFPREEGLLEISDKYYNDIVCRTEVFEKYVGLLSDSPEEILKNTIFYGDFGMGKTTLFDYLRSLMITQASCHPIYIQLLPEIDAHALMSKFKIKLLEELRNLFHFLENRPAETFFEPFDPDPVSTQIYQIAEQIVKSGDCEGFVVFVDDLHKQDFGPRGREIFQSVVSLLSGLQTFCSEFSRKARMKMAFYVAAVPGWESKLKGISALSGSFSRHERMPEVTIDIAVEMLDKRFAAFALNKQNPPRIDENLVRRVYTRGKEANEVITWRTFIRSIVHDELQLGHFNVLQSSPLSLTEQRRRIITERLESHGGLMKQIRSFVYGGQIQSAENRVECIKRLIDIHLKGSISEEKIRSLSQDERYHYERLADAGLIRKRRIDDENGYVISPELRKANDEVMSEFSLSLEDYLLPIYGSRQLKTAKGEKVVVELAKLEELVDRNADLSLKALLKESSYSHKLILERLNDYSRPLERNITELVNRSIVSITGALALVEESEQPKNLEQARQYWSENWILPGEVSEFFRRSDTELLSEKDLPYVLRSYQEAFVKIVSLLDRLDFASRVISLPKSRLTRSEMQTLDHARDQLVNKRYFGALKETTDLLEIRLRTFCFNIFSLLYRDPQDRIVHLDDESRKYISEARQKHKHAESNEFELINRGQYGNFITGTSPQGRANWREIFQHVFESWSEEKTNDFLKRFAEMNVMTSHNKLTAINRMDQNELSRYMSDCVTFLGSLNLSYQTLLQKCHYTETRPTEPRNAHYFSLHKFSDKPRLTPIFIPKESLKQLVHDIESRMDVTPIVDFSDWQFIKSMFNCDYRQFLAFFSVVWEKTRNGSKDMPIRVNIQHWFGSEAKLEFFKTKTT